MDPDAAWSALAKAVADGEWQEASAVADGLLTWLNRGGFPPAITGFASFDTIAAKATCESISCRGV
jgi:hypothetical protein